MKPGKHQRSKQRCQDLCWKVRDPNNLLFCSHTLYTSQLRNPTRFYWLVPQYGVNNYCVCARSTSRAKKLTKTYNKEI